MNIDILSQQLEEMLAKRSADLATGIGEIQARVYSLAIFYLCVRQYLFDAKTIRPSVESFGKFLNLLVDEVEKDHPQLSEGLSSLVDFETKNFDDVESRDSLLEKCYTSFWDWLSANAKMLDRQSIFQLFHYIVENTHSRMSLATERIYTPPEILRLLTKLGNVKKGYCVGDIAMGSFGFMAAAAGEVVNREIIVRGFSENKTTRIISLMEIQLGSFQGGIENYGCFSELSLKYDGTFDCIISNPPFSVSDWMNNGALDKKHFKWGMPPPKNADYAFISRALNMLNGSGRAAIIVPNGALFRENERHIRKNLVDDNLIDAVISLPHKVFSKVTVATAILIFDKAKPNKGIMLIDGASILSSKREKLSEQDIEKIVDCYRKREGNDKARLVTPDEIESTNYLLTPDTYIESTSDDDAIDETALLREISDLEDKLKNIRGSLYKFI